MSNASQMNAVASLLLRTGLAGGILAVGATVMVFLSKKPPEPEVQAAPPAIPQAIVVPVREHTGAVDITVDGIAVPYREIEIAGEVSGRVVEKADNCRPGYFVTEGSLLLQIDPSDYELEVERLQELVRQSEVNASEVEQEEINVGNMLELATRDRDLKDRDVQRAKTLRLDNATSESDVDLAMQSLLVAETQIQTHRNAKLLLATKRGRLAAAKAIAEAQLKRAKLNLKRTKIVAPTTGVIVDTMAEKGDYVQLGAPILKIEDTSQVEVKCNLQMDDMYWVWNQPRTAEAAASGYQIPETDVTVAYRLAGHEDIEYTWPGVLRRYDGIGLDESTRTVPCRVVVAKPHDVTVWKHGVADPQLAGTGPQALVRGMFVTIKIHTKPAVRIVRIPQVALRPGKKLGLVRDGIYRESNQVKVICPFERHAADRHDKYWLVEADLNTIASTDLIVTNSLMGVADGTVVRVKGATPLPAQSDNDSTSLSSVTEVLAE